jgi:hypothetical protein
MLDARQLLEEAPAGGDDQRVRSLTLSPTLV